MPVFHTKTIESILEPVAQQVSRLVVLHEEAEDGNAMPNLTQSVHAVKLAVDNLVKIGYETTNTSQDEILKQDMPPALQRVEQAAEWLLEASKYLTEDPYSAPARKKLIEGSRGILQGTSDLLLAFDESEVRKIIVQCNAVMDYLNIAEVIENLTDLITFVKNISPGLTRMSKQVDDREKELTNQAHRTILQQCLEKIRELTPMLISSIKVHVNQMNANSPAESDSRSNRDYMCKSMCKQIQEIIRVLQLTSSEPEETTGDDAADMRNCAADMMNKFNAAHDWLADPQAVPGGIGDRAINDMLASALKAADRCPDHEAQQQIQKAVSDIKSMMDALSELRANGQGDTPQAHALSKSIEQKLGELVDLINGVANNVEKAGARATARTLQGRLEAAKAWLHAPTKQLAGMDGEAAARKVIADSRTLAKRIADGKTREELLRLCDEAEKQLDDLCLHCQYGTANTPQARAIAHALSSKLSEIEAAVNQAVNDKVVDVFLDVNGPLKALSAAANVPKDTPHREERYNDKSGAFNEHSVQLAESAALVAYSSSTQNKSTLDQIHHTAKQVAQLAPQVVSAGKIVLVDPSEESAQEHFELMKKQWADKSEKLRTLVDENTDPLTFIKSTEAAMIEDTGNVESSIIGVEPQGIVENAANIARRANRLIQLAQQEADNSEDPALRKDISLVSDRLKSLMPDMIKNAKLLTLNPRDYHAAETWRNSNNGLLDAVRDMRILMEGQQMTFQPLLSPGLPDMTDLSLCLSPEVYSKIYTYAPRTPVLTEPPNIGMAILTTPTSEEAPPRPPLPAEEAPPPRPPSPDPVAPDQDAELERVFKNQPQENQPILLAAHNLHQEVRHWDSSDNELIQAAKQMALLMARLSQIVRGEGGTKKDLIDIAKQIAEASEAVTRLAKGLAAECTDKRVRTNLLQVCERIPTIGTQLKILSTVKATMLGSQESSSQEDDEATEMLVGNAQNLMQSVKDAVHAAEGASIKIRVQSGYSIRWVRRRPWYA